MAELTNDSNNQTFIPSTDESQPHDSEHDFLLGCRQLMSTTTTVLFRTTLTQTITLNRLLILLGSNLIWEG